LSVINDFTILTRFDDLLDLSDLGIKLEQDFIANVHPYHIESTKYTIKDNKKHQTSTFGQSENKSSDSHTDTNVKEILKQIPVLVYSDSSKLS
jgi:hypothetical protein